MTKGSLAVFRGPSLPREDVIENPAITYFPPAARGDVENASREFAAILLIDGTFHHDLAPSPKECYGAAQRTRCFGAASMGALRAAECAPYGFQPLGAIARWYRNEVIDGDDEVAVLVDPQTHRALSVPLVNVRYAARILRNCGVLTREEGAILVTRARRIFYMDRTWTDVLDLAPSRAARDRLEAIAQDADLKRLDARTALRSVVRRLRRPFSDG